MLMSTPISVICDYGAENIEIMKVNPNLECK